MYSSAPFREARQDVLFQFIRDNPLGALISNAEAGGLSATHAPLLLEPASGPHGVLCCHLARANPHWQELAASPAVLVIFGGAEHYVSPSWYPSKREHGKVVPTWNYAAVHVRGRARIFGGHQDLLAHLKALTSANEALFSVPWTIENAPTEYIEGLTRSIVGIEITIEDIEGKWKLSQNRSASDQEGVVAGLEQLGTERSLRMADLMKKRRSEY